MPSIVTVGNDNKPKEDNSASLPTTQPLANSSLSAKPTSKPPVTMREFGDANATRDLIYNNVLEAAKQIQPVSNNRYTLSLHNPHWGEEANYSIADRKRAILRSETMQRRLKGTWRLSDPEGKLLGERTSTIAHVPHLTNQGTFVINGSEYTLGHQMRLQPGIFARRKENGEIESHINILPGKGLSHHYFLEPETGVFKMKIAQANLPLISVLKTMGVSDKELRDAWGNDLYNTNLAKDDPRVVDKLYDKLIGRKGKADATSAEKAEAVGRSLQAMELNPEVTKRTLGQAFPKLSKEAALATSKKLLAISRGEADTDDRDHLAFQNFLGPEDLFAERMGRDKRVLNEALWKVTTKGDLHALPTGVFTPHVHAALLDSGLGQALEEINSSDVLDQQTRVSRLGYGGIPSIDAVPDEARSVQPSHIGFIDLLRTPESFKVGVDSRVSSVARKGSDGRIYTPFIDAKSGQNVYRSPQDIADMTVAFPGEMEQGKSTVRAQVAGKTRTVPKSQVDLIMPHAEHWFSPINNLVPLKSAVKGQRAAMASRFITQALPLEKAESPHVRGQVPGSPGRSFEEHYGQHMGAVRAKDVGGRVESVNPEGITVKYADGTSQTHELYNNFPYNRKTFQHNTAMVKPGDPIRPGQLLAKSNYTDDQGHVALGKNFRVAYMPFRGANYEDAYVISEAAAKRLSSEHMYQHNLEWEDKHRRGKYPFISLFPGMFNKQQFKNIDKDGVIAPGTVIQPGDPLILAAKERELSKKQVHTAHRGSFSNESLTWDHHSPGIVTDVEKTAKGVTVAVKTINKSQVGDKMCYDAETRILTKIGWKWVTEITVKDEIATLNPATDELEWQQPTNTWVYDHNGLMYKLVTKHLDMLVTLEHKLWVAKPNKPYQAITAAELYESKGTWQFKKDCKWTGKRQDIFTFPIHRRPYNARTKTLTRVSMSDWLEFLGYYIAEGWSDSRGYVKIGQFKKSPAWPKIDALLKRIGLPYCYNEDDGRFELGNIWLNELLKPLGNSYTKRVPEFIQELSPDQIQIFFNAYMAGDGHKGAAWEYSSSSERLVYDVQLLCMKLGYSVRVIECKKGNNNWMRSRHWRGRINRSQLRPCRTPRKLKLYKGNEEGLVTYTGKVYCVTVPNHIIYVERRGKSYWSLNSGRYG